MIEEVKNEIFYRNAYLCVEKQHVCIRAVSRAVLVYVHVMVAEYPTISNVVVFLSLYRM